MFRNFPETNPIRARFLARRHLLRYAGLYEPFDKDIAMHEATQVAAKETNADGRANPVSRLDEELRFLK